MYRLENIVRMSSSYGVRIYELIVHWKDCGKKEVSVQWLREALQLGEKYKAIKDFKKYVLEPAISDINKETDFLVNWKQRKTGRVVTHLNFTFRLKEGEKKVSSESEVKILGIKKSIIEKSARAGETYEQAALRIKNKSKEIA